MLKLSFGFQPGRGKDLALSPSSSRLLQAMLVDIKLKTIVVYSLLQDLLELAHYYRI